VAFRDSSGATLALRTRADALVYIEQRYPWNTWRLAGADTLYKWALDILFEKTPAPAPVPNGAKKEDE
jgi:hypothetical protein